MMDFSVSLSELLHPLSLAYHIQRWTAMLWSLAESSDEHVALVLRFNVITSYTRHLSFFDLAYMKIAGIEEHHHIESTYSIIQYQQQTIEPRNMLG